MVWYGFPYQTIAYMFDSEGVICHDSCRFPGQDRRRDLYLFS